MDIKGKSYNTSKQVQFLMKSVRKDVKHSHHNQSYMSRAVNVLLTQMSATEGIRKHGEKAVAVLIKEFKQLDQGPMDGKKVVEAILYQTLTAKEKRKP